MAIASSLHAPLAAGLWGIFGMALAASLLTVLLATRLPRHGSSATRTPPGPA